MPLPPPWSSAWDLCCLELPPPRCRLPRLARRCLPFIRSTASQWRGALDGPMSWRAASPCLRCSRLPYLPFAVTLMLYVGLRQAALGTLVGESRASGIAVLASVIGAFGVY